MKIGNTQVKLHFSILLLFVLLTWQCRAIDTNPLIGILSGAMLTVIVFSMALLHEMAHVKAAERMGYHTDIVILWAFGGAAQIPGLLNASPKKEFIVAIAGPLSNIVVAIITFFVALLLGVDLLEVSNLYTLYLPFVMMYIFWYNTLMGLLNMIPAFPMDGGRVMRAILSIFMPALKATKIAVYIAKGFAIMFSATGIVLSISWGAIIMPLIGIYIWRVASMELKHRLNPYG
ncbi:hypothetical protein LCGC14_0533270 [marine sediment metagenome]|uniref:Peptidase M50 domain-containing protein n=1 Tax=marine sediment metagenome TaxID=412755 RepID=A0A0F9SDB2_9ZZZZ